MTVPYSFANATVSIPLSQLDANFNTPITLGNTAIQLGNTVTTLNNMTLANVTISSGNVTITNVSVTTANVTTGNITNMVSGNVTITGGSINGTTLGATTASTANVTTLTTSSTVTINGGTANGVAYLNGSKVLTTGSALTFDGTNISTALGGSYYSANANYGFGTPDSAGLQIFAASGDSIRFGSRSAGTFSEQMRLTSTGLGIGTSSPGALLHVSNPSAKIRVGLTASDQYLDIYRDNATGYTIYNAAQAATFRGHIWQLGGSSAMTLDSSGNLGLGVTPSAWTNSFGVIQGLGGWSISHNGVNSNSADFLSNAYRSGGANTYLYVASSNATRYQQLAGAHAWYTAPSGTAGNTISFTQAMTLDASGNLGVGTTSPSTYGKFVVDNTGAAAPVIYGRSGDQAGARIAISNTGAGGQTWQIVAGDVGVSNSGLSFYDGTATRARITSGGDLLVGTTSGNSRITAAYSSTNTFGILSENAADNPGVDGAAVIGNLSSSTGTNNTTAVIFRGRSAGADRFYVYGNGNVQNTNNSYGAISDVKLKENITDATPKLENLNRLRVVNYNLKGDTLKQIGLIAQEVEQVFPGLVDESPDVDPDTKEPTGEVTKSVKYSVLVPMLLKAVQELTVMNDDLRARVAQLEAK